MSRKSPSANVNRFLLASFLLVGIALVTIRCEKWEKPENDPTHSAHNENESHKSGQNCMNCHYSEGTGEGWFSIAGSISGDYGGGIVHVTNSAGATASIEIDQRGNFYTTNSFDFSGGANVFIEKNGVAVSHMSGTIYTGQCNLCHGVTTSTLSL